MDYQEACDIIESIENISSFITMDMLSILQKTENLYIFSTDNHATFMYDFGNYNTLPFYLKVKITLSKLLSAFLLYLSFCPKKQNGQVVFKNNIYIYFR